VIRLPIHNKTRVTSGLTTEVTGEVTGEVTRLLRAVDGEMSRLQLQQALALKHEDHFPLPDTPRSSKQRYRLTGKGLQHRRPADGAR